MTVGWVSDCISNFWLAKYEFHLEESKKISILQASSTEGGREISIQLKGRPNESATLAT